MTKRLVGRAVAAWLMVLAAPVAAVSQDAPQMWEGVYTCPLGQGPTAMTLAAEPGEGGQVAARATFYALPENPGVPTGCYTLTGVMGPGEDGVRLSPTGWIHRPFDYIATGLIGDLDPATGVIEGRIDHDFCGSFRLEPLNGRPSAAPRCPPAVARAPGEVDTRLATR